MPYGQAKSHDVFAKRRGRGPGYTDKMPSAQQQRRAMIEGFSAQQQTTPKPKHVVTVLSPRATMIRANHARRRAAWLRKHTVEN